MTEASTTPQELASKLRALDDEEICFTDITPLLRTAADTIEAQAAEIARLTVLASRSELSAVAKALAWKGPYQCSLAGRVEALIVGNETMEAALDAMAAERDAAKDAASLLDRVICAFAEDLGVEPDNEAIHLGVQAIRDERDAAVGQVKALRGALEELASVVERDCGVDPCSTSMAPAERYLALAHKALSTEGMPPTAQDGEGGARGS